MTGHGFMEPRKLSPTGLAVVIAMHASALGALALMKGPEIMERLKPITLIEIAEPPEPEPRPEPPPERRADRPTPKQQSVIDQVTPAVERPLTGPIVDRGPAEIPEITNVAIANVPEVRVEPPPPVRVAAEFDPRYAADQQPPYPPNEERAGREGSVRVRITIGTDGRVHSVERLSATSDAFWSATERHARNRWRFRPATVDGRPIQSTKIMTVRFELRG